MQPSLPAKKSPRNVIANWVARAQLKLGDEGVLFQKEAREIGSEDSSFLCHRLLDRFSISLPVLGPPPPLLLEPVTPLGGLIGVLQC